ncbi:uncharacterized protein TNCV_2413041 [Trichonephila clavipes]|nr:uncharacterized protein TNCV_2413041 [Trichonephila clavipes]
MLAIGLHVLLGQESTDWSVEVWKRVAWRDESRFRLLHTDGRMRIWHQAHEAMDPARLELYKGMVAQSCSGVFFVVLFGIFDECIISLRCNSARRISERSPPYVYVVLLSGLLLWSFPARQLYLSQVPVRDELAT